MKENQITKYYEIWELHQSWLRLSKQILLFLASLCMILVIATILIARKPPAIITIGELGQANYIKDYRFQNQKAENGEITYFVKTFLNNYIGLRSDKIRDQMALAMNLMTKTYQQTHDEDIRKNNSLTKIIEANIKTELSFIKIDIVEDSEKYLLIDAEGIRSIAPLNSLQSEPKREGFRSSFRLLRVQRSEFTPNGLLVDDFKNEFVSLTTIEQGKNIQIPLPEVQE